MRSQKGRSATLSILVSEKDHSGLKKTFMISIFCSVFCLVFSMIYNIFSHGVHSPFMTFSCVWPLLSALPSCIFLLADNIPGPGLLACLVWNTGVAAVTVSSILRGIFEIAGNSSFYQELMMYAGFVMLFFGLALYIAGIILSGRDN